MNDTYCHGIVNCKYCYEGECDFFDMGSGNPDDMPCISQSISDINEFCKWREEKYGETT